MRQYKEAYRYWHAVEMAKNEPDLVISRSARPFPIPAICQTQRADPLRYDVLYVSDFSQPGEKAVFNAYTMEAGHRLGLTQAWFHWPSVDAVSRTVDAQVRKRAHMRMADCIVAGEKVDCNVVVVSHPAILNHAPRLPSRSHSPGLHNRGRSIAVWRYSRQPLPFRSSCSDGAPHLSESSRLSRRSYRAFAATYASARKLPD